MAATVLRTVALALFLLLALCARRSAGRSVIVLEGSNPAESAVHGLMTQPDSSSTKPSNLLMDPEGLHSFSGSAKPKGSKVPPKGASGDPYVPTGAFVHGQRLEDLKETESDMKSLFGLSKPKGSKAPPKGPSGDPYAPPQRAFVHGQRSEDLKETDMKSLFGLSKPKGSKPPPKGSGGNP